MRHFLYFRTPDAAASALSRLRSRVGPDAATLLSDRCVRVIAPQFFPAVRAEARRACGIVTLPTPP